MNISSKLTLYDTLGILVPGFIVLWWFDFFGITSNVQLETTSWMFVVILSYAIGLIYHRILECIMKCIGMRRNPHMMESQWKKVKKTSEVPDNIQKLYDAAYIRITKEGCLLSIPVLEAQETFLRNALFILVGSIVKIAVEQNGCLSIVLLTILLVLCVIFWIQSLNKIYYMVWDTDQYLKNEK